MSVSQLSHCVYQGCEGQQPWLSIIIPTFKRPSLLREALASVLAQDAAPDYQVIVVDNACSQDTLEIAKELRSSRVSVYHNLANVGMWGSMGIGIAVASGEWILILCDDDLLLPNALGQFATAVSRNQKDRIGCLAGGTLLNISEDVQPILKGRGDCVQFPFVAPQRRADPFLVPPGTDFLEVPKLCSSIFRKEEILRAGGWDRECEGYADLAMFLRMQKHGLLYGSTEIFGKFGVHSGNESNLARIWTNYPVTAAEILFTRYLNDGSPSSDRLRHRLEGAYVRALWTTRLSTSLRRQYAGEVLAHVARTKFNYPLLSLPWLLELLAMAYRFARPRIGTIFRALRGNLPKHLTAGQE